jgi:hydrogenase nickel incorporation protein HypB
MCATCGCGTVDHEHDHAHPKHVLFDVPRSRRQRVEIDLLAKNDRIATENRRRFSARGVQAVNLMSSPGAGKTTLLEATIRALGDERPVVVIEGDQETERDALRIRAAGARAIQINTGTGCHLDAEMVARAFDQLDPAAGTLLMIENVGNLVCPALFDLGEERRVVLMSVTEGDDKPLKYPHMFRKADLLVVNKIDLLPYVSFDLHAAVAYARELRPGLPVVLTSADRSDGIEDWLAFLGGATNAAHEATASGAPA